MNGFVKRTTMKVSGRRKVRFHLDDLIIIAQDASGFRWACCLAKTALGGSFREVCDGAGHFFEFQREAEEAALSHLSMIHRGVGGERRNNK